VRREEIFSKKFQGGKISKCFAKEKSLNIPPRENLNNPNKSKDFPFVLLKKINHLNQ